MSTLKTVQYCLVLTKIDICNIQKNMYLYSCSMYYAPLRMGLVFFFARSPTRTKKQNYFYIYSSRMHVDHCAWDLTTFLLGSQSLLNCFLAQCQNSWNSEFFYFHTINRWKLSIYGLFVSDTQYFHLFQNEKINFTF